MYTLYNGSIQVKPECSIYLNIYIYIYIHIYIFILYIYVYIYTMFFCFSFCGASKFLGLLLPLNPESTKGSDSLPNSMGNHYKSYLHAYLCQN